MFQNTDLDRPLASHPSPLVSRSSPVDVHVGSRIRSQRNQLKISQRALGERLGLTVEQIQKHESGANRVGASKLYEISQVLDVPISFFFADPPSVPDLTGPLVFVDEKLSHGINDNLSNPEMVEVLRAYDRILDPTIRRRVLDLLRILAPEDLVER